MILSRSGLFFHRNNRTDNHCSQTGQRLLSACLAMVFIAGCSGVQRGTSGSVVPAEQSIWTAHNDSVRDLPSNAKRHRVHIAMTIFIPRHRRPHGKRSQTVQWHGHIVRPGYVSAGTRSVSISVNGGAAEPSNIGAEAPDCIQESADELACTIPIDAPIGTDSFEVKLWDGSDGQGKLLGAATTSSDVTVVPGELDITVGGVVSSIDMQPFASPPPSQCGVGQQDSTVAHPILITVYDADHYQITGDDPYYNPITLTDSDTSGVTSASPALVTSPSVNPQFVWTGQDIPVMPEISASADNVPATTQSEATFDPGGPWPLVPGSRYTYENGGGNGDPSFPFAFDHWFVSAAMPYPSLQNDIPTPITWTTVPNMCSLASTDAWSSLSLFVPPVIPDGDDGNTLTMMYWLTTARESNWTGIELRDAIVDDWGFPANGWSFTIPEILASESAPATVAPPVTFTAVSSQGWWGGSSDVYNGALTPPRDSFITSVYEGTFPGSSIAMNPSLITHGQAPVPPSCGLPPSFPKTATWSTYTTYGYDFWDSANDPYALQWPYDIYSNRNIGVLCILSAGNPVSALVNYAIGNSGCNQSTQLRRRSAIKDLTKLLSSRRHLYPGPDGTGVTAPTPSPSPSSSPLPTPTPLQTPPPCGP
jgi:hypothetical protein